jgi:hypothetical protein
LKIALKITKHLISLLLLLSACLPQEHKSAKVNYYYDLQEALEKLDKNSTAFLKTTITEGKKQSQIVRNIDWEKELAFFQQANLNKAAFRNGYQERKSTNKDTTFITYETENQDFKVKQLIIGLLPDSSLAKVEAFIRTDNYLYSSEKYLQIFCKNNKLQSYRISGKQKMIFSEPEYFEVTAQILTQ